ncbi:MAG: SCO family protein [Gammaproteobacteria bacterium]|nr:SCO family protein [Gammaproteobacteria bacterium]
MARNRFTHSLIWLLILPAWLACGVTAAADKARGVAIDPPKQITKNTLTDQEGRPAVFPAGQWQLVFFGFTNCPDVCPVTLHKAMQVMKQPGPQVAALKVTFISIDPERDKPEVVKAYVAAHGTGIQGLTGNLVATQKVGSEFEVVVRRYQDRETATPRFEHSAFLYLLDPQGRLVMFYPATVEASGITADIVRLAKAGK